MKKLLIGATAVAVFFGGTALAADMPVKAPVYKAAPAEMFNWSGWYAGANVGYGFSSNRTDFNPVDPGAVARVAFVTPQVSDNPKGFLGSLQLGVNKQFG